MRKRKPTPCFFSRRAWSSLLRLLVTRRLYNGGGGVITWSALCNLSSSPHLHPARVTSTSRASLRCRLTRWSGDRPEGGPNVGRGGEGKKRGGGGQRAHCSHNLMSFITIISSVPSTSVKVRAKDVGRVLLVGQEFIGGREKERKRRGRESALRIVAVPD